MDPGSVDRSDSYRRHLIVGACGAAASPSPSAVGIAGIPASAEPSAVVVRTRSVPRGGRR